MTDVNEAKIVAFQLDPCRIDPGCLPRFSPAHRTTIARLVAEDLVAHPPGRNRLGKPLPPGVKAWHRLRRAVVGTVDGKALALEDVLQAAVAQPRELDRLALALLAALDTRAELVARLGELDRLAEYFASTRESLDNEFEAERKRAEVAHGRIAAAAALRAHEGAA